MISAQAVLLYFSEREQCHHHAREDLTKLGELDIQKEACSLCTCLDGSVPSFFANHSRPKLITYEGCRQLCGSGIEYYPWANASQTVTTWVLPIAGVLIQAPWESNEFWRTLFALTRWIGSPMATLSYTLWNVKVTGKCAMMVDMAIEYGLVPDEGSPFARIRDSFYILSVMNQCMS